MIRLPEQFGFGNITEQPYKSYKLECYFEMEEKIRRNDKPKAYTKVFSFEAGFREF